LEEGMEKGRKERKLVRYSFNSCLLVDAELACHWGFYDDSIFLWNTVDD